MQNMPEDHPGFNSYLACLLLHDHQGHPHPGVAPDEYTEWAALYNHPHSIANIPTAPKTLAPSQLPVRPPSSDIDDWLSVFRQPQGSAGDRGQNPIPVGRSTGHSTYGEVPPANPMTHAHHYSAVQAPSTAF